MIKFREYNQDQGLALPPYLEEMIDKNHLVRVINRLVDCIPIENLAAKFSSNKHNQGGNRPYHPKMILKVLIYAYATGVYTSRKIAKQLRENVNFMWLSGMQKPDFRTINRYRSNYLLEVFPQVFSEVLYVLSDKKLLDLNTVFIDGTKLAADCNKHKVVWKKNVERYKAKLRVRVDRMFSEIAALDAEEMKRYGDLDLPERGKQSKLTSDDLQEASSNISKALEVDGKSSHNKTGQKLRKTAYQLKEDSKKLKRYDQQSKDLGSRNSISKTDTEATVMKMKNEELRPGYNVQAVTSGDFIVSTCVTQNANDGSSLPPVMQRYKESGLSHPQRLVADAGYGHEEVYNYLETEGITAYVKYPSYYAEKSNEAKYQYHYSKFTYLEAEDVFVCPQGKKLYFVDTSEDQSISGYRSQKRIYQCKDCKGCEVKDKCTRSTRGRTLTVNFKLRDYQEKVRKRLSTEEGDQLYSERGYRTETIFGEWKHNLKFRRFNLRGLQKVNAEVILLSLAYNFKKLAKYLGHFPIFCKKVFKKIVIISNYMFPKPILIKAMRKSA